MGVTTLRRSSISLKSVAKKKPMPNSAERQYPILKRSDRHLRPAVTFGAGNSTAIGAAFATQSANEPRGPRHPRIDRERLNCWVGPRVPLGGKRVDPRIGAYRDLSNKGSERSKADPVAKTYRWDCEEHRTKYHERIGFLYPDHPDNQDDERCGDSDESLDSERRHFIAI